MKPLSEQNLYEILDVPFDATSAEIAEAVGRAQALYAPGSLATYTLMDPDEEQLLLRLIEEARVTLLDPEARARYDERITGPDQPHATAPAPTAPPALDAAIRAAWPELPPVIPALQAQAEDEEWEEDLPVPPAIAPARPAEPAPVIPTAEVAAVPAASVVEAAPAAAEQPPPPPARAAPIPLSKEIPAPPVPSEPAPTPVPDTTSWSGEVLRRLREARGISIQQISERTKVTRHHIENIEADRFEQLPASVYLRGILLSIARELRLDGQKVARSYLERVSAASSATASMPRPR